MNLAPVPFQRELESMRERFDRLFGEWAGITTAGERLPVAVDLQETDDAFVVKASLPGMKAEEVDVDFHKGMLTIKAETTEETTEEKENYLMRERRFGSVQRSISIPATVREDAIEANLSEGVLTVTLPKAEESERRKISVKRS